MILSIIQAGALLAQENPLPPLLNAGVLGALAVCFIVGLIVPKSMLDKCEARAERSDARAQEMLEHYKEVVTVLQTATAAITAVDQARQAQMQQDAELRVVLRDVRAALEERR